eukprot:355307-Chlamydomonas_euryale.AAC.2
MQPPPHPPRTRVPCRPLAHHRGAVPAGAGSQVRPPSTLTPHPSHLPHSRRRHLYPADHELIIEEQYLQAQEAKRARRLGLPAPHAGANGAINGGGASDADAAANTAAAVFAHFEGQKKNTGEVADGLTGAQRRFVWGAGVWGGWREAHVFVSIRTAELDSPHSPSVHLSRPPTTCLPTRNVVFKTS